MTNRSGAYGSFMGTPATAPGPSGPEMFRAFSAIRGNPLGYLARVWREHGDVVQFPIPRPPSYLVNDPDAVRRVLVEQARSYGKSTIQYRALSLVTGEGLLTSDADVWRRQRRMVQPAFHHETLAQLANHVERSSSSVLADWERAGTGAIVDIDSAMMHATLEVVGHALFGSDLSQDASALADATLEALDVVVARARVPITPPGWLPTRANRRLGSANNVLDSAVRRMIAERVHAQARTHDMLDMLMEVRDEHGNGLSGEEIRNQMVTFIVAGHETVASALTWAWALLAAHPHEQEALQDELAQIVQNAPLTIDDYPRLVRTRAVFDEALRLYPPAWLITRKALEARELAGGEVPAGSLVIMSPWLLHRHPSLWRTPEEFRPSRFLDEDVDRSSFLPFGAGPRMCIGRDFAYLEGVLMLARLASRFEVSYPGDEGVPAVDPVVTIRPAGGLKLRITRRAEGGGPPHGGLHWS
jgi:cytochrome P450